MSILSNEGFYCYHLGENKNDKTDIQLFSVKDVRGQGLENYIKHSAFYDEEDNTMRTYLIRDNVSSELVGYFSLKAGLVSFNGCELACFSSCSQAVPRVPRQCGILAQSLSR